MKVLVGCEFSGIVRQAFRDLGHDAWSCDILPSEDNSNYHIQDDVLLHLNDGWDLAIFHPPCTFLTTSANRWLYDPKYPNRNKDRQTAITFFLQLMFADIPKIAIENPVGILSTHFRRPDQIIQPWQFGHGEVKRTCFWLKNLPLLIPTNIVEGRIARVHREAPSPSRWKERSRTYKGIAQAMAEQWREDVR
jgi:hypothetical protein